MPDVENFFNPNRTGRAKQAFQLMFQQDRKTEDSNKARNMLQELANEWRSQGSIDELKKTLSLAAEILGTNPPQAAIANAINTAAKQVSQALNLAKKILGTQPKNNQLKKALDLASKILKTRPVGPSFARGGIATIPSFNEVPIAHQEAVPRRQALFNEAERAKKENNKKALAATAALALWNKAGTGWESNKSSSINKATTDARAVNLTGINRKNINSILNAKNFTPPTNVTGANRSRHRERVKKILNKLYTVPSSKKKELFVNFIKRHFYPPTSLTVASENANIMKELKNFKTKNPKIFESLYVRNPKYGLIKNNLSKI
jgi:hypothetical protein